MSLEYQAIYQESYVMVRKQAAQFQRNPTNYFAEIEQLAFAPSHMIPGKPFDTQESFLYIYYHIFSYLTLLYLLLSKFVRKEILLTVLVPQNTDLTKKNLIIKQDDMFLKELSN